MKRSIKKFDQLVKETKDVYRILLSIQERLNEFAPEEIDEVDERELHGFPEFAEFASSVDEAVADLDFWGKEN